MLNATTMAETITDTMVIDMNGAMTTIEAAVDMKAMVVAGTMTAMTIADTITVEAMAAT
eukprot:gene14774-19544_t